MTHTVRIARWAAPVAVETGQTVLEAALQAGVPYPHGCRSGNCGACKSRLLRGEVEMAPWSEFALTGAERAAGLVLACRTVPWGDAEIAWLGEDDVAAHPVRKVAGRVEAVEAMTRDISAVRVSIADGGPFAFSAGQYCRLRFAGLPARDFSMANMPGEEKLEFHVRRVAGGAVSAYVADRLAVGEAVGLEGPFGAAFLRESHCGPIYAVAGGSGLAPAKSIVERALAGGAARGVSLYFGVRDERDLYLEDRFESLARAHANFRFVPVLSGPGAPTRRRTGLVHEALAADAAGFDGCKAYVAGPPPMVEAACALLAARGMRREDVHADAFYTEAEKAAKGEA